MIKQQSLYQNKVTNYNGGQKCWDLCSDITKTSDPSPPTPNKVEFGSEWVKMSAFFGQTIAGGSGGDDGMNPKLSKNLSLGTGPYVTIAWKGFFTQSQVVLSSIVAWWHAFVMRGVHPYSLALPTPFPFLYKCLPRRLQGHPQPHFHL